MSREELKTVAMRVGEILVDDVMVRVRVWVRWPGGAPFIGAAHVHHHHVVSLTIQNSFGLR